VAERAAQLDARLNRVVERFDGVVEVRGRGLLRGLRVDLGSDQERLLPEIVPTAAELGLLVLRSGSDVVRIAPPLVISAKDLDLGMTILETTLERIHNRRNP
jgi:acetylornithine/succinyldiaminopimelate/putrescine aminotransferase